ncbi:NUDIX hydrolase [Nakamurella sp. YIM 132087]|uniref:NUDIX hydrolase n=1 Tax=Nakamurella alba TaxID=2665158 RepID=A0A7K1FGP2_9ACTN|nr:NUDIX domain-containing protein [Nakamurella alba]MTD12453.1 NUDIX hydrolase [Nakamurella alba]
MDLRSLGEAARRRAFEYLDAGLPAVEPRDSAAVVLLRDGEDGIELCMLMRSHAMATSGGVPVFPGGLIDPADGETRWLTGDPTEWAEALGTDRDLARAVVAGAVRELFEETGILLAEPRPPGGTMVARTWTAARRDLEAHRLTFADFLAARSLGIRTDGLRLWSTWITTEFESRRYRNAFFLAALPAGQEAEDGSTESDGLRWFRCDDLLAGAASGTLEVLPPQLSIALELREHRAVADALAAATAPREVVLPELRIAGDRLDLILPQHLVDRAAAWRSDEPTR